jgi:hypothetical protein
MIGHNCLRGRSLLGDGFRQTSQRRLHRSLCLFLPLNALIAQHWFFRLQSYSYSPFRRYQWLRSHSLNFQSFTCLVLKVGKLFHLLIDGALYHRFSMLKCLLILFDMWFASSLQRVLPNDLVLHRALRSLKRLNHPEPVV